MKYRLYFNTIRLLGNQKLILMILNKYNIEIILIEAILRVTENENEYEKASESMSEKVGERRTGVRLE